MKRLLLPCLAIAAMSGCVTVKHKTDPLVIRIEPIYAEITVNLRVQEKLDDIFAELDAASTTSEVRPLEDLTKQAN